ncbi:MAG: PQQ-binding-like beta-propeller repeat protein, partial [Rubripirellula sp.]
MSRCYCLIFALVLLATAGSQGIAENWPGWRGLRGDGTSLESNLPTEWDGESGKNIRWKAAIPGSGFSSPVIHGDRIFLTSCDESEETRLLHCVDRKSGALIWTQEVLESPLEGVHKLNGRASGTPATDGERVFVTFFRTDSTNGERGEPGEMLVGAFDYDGN